MKQTVAILLALAGVLLLATGFIVSANIDQSRVIALYKDEVNTLQTTQRKLEKEIKSYQASKDSSGHIRTCLRMTYKMIKSFIIRSQYDWLCDIMQEHNHSNDSFWSHILHSDNTMLTHCILMMVVVLHRLHSHIKFWHKYLCKPKLVSRANFFWMV